LKIGTKVRHLSRVFQFRSAVGMANWYKGLALGLERKMTASALSSLDKFKEGASKKLQLQRYYNHSRKVLTVKFLRTICKHLLRWTRK